MSAVIPERMRDRSAEHAEIRDRDIRWAYARRPSCLIFNLVVAAMVVLQVFDPGNLAWLHLMLLLVANLLLVFVVPGDVRFAIAEDLPTSMMPRVFSLCIIGLLGFDKVPRVSMVISTASTALFVAVIAFYIARARFAYAQRRAFGIGVLLAVDALFIAEFALPYLLS